MNKTCVGDLFSTKCYCAGVVKMVVKEIQVIKDTLWKLSRRR